MWREYRKRFLVNQVLFAAVLVGIRVISPERGWFELLVFWLVMQLAAFPGAWWSARLRRKMKEDSERLPLDHR